MAGGCVPPPCPAANGQFPFAQGVQQPQFFRHRAGRQVAAQGAFAGQQFGQVHIHRKTLPETRAGFNPTPEATWETVRPKVVGEVGRARQFGGRPAGWETRETADWEVCGTKNPPQLRDAPGYLRDNLTKPASNIPAGGSAGTVRFLTPPAMGLASSPGPSSTRTTRYNHPASPRLRKDCRRH